jgi:hypothetical protein
LRTKWRWSWNTSAQSATNSTDTLALPLYKSETKVSFFRVLVEDRILALIQAFARTTYVGTADPDAPMTAPTTLSMSVPEGVSHVTFNKEFDG